MEEVAAPPAVVNEPTCASVGLTSDPVISDAARRANEEALAAHGRGDYAASEAGFAAALAEAPSYRSARFNHVCALSRLGRLEDARAELIPLLCEDLPSFSERVRSDPDLAAIQSAALDRDLDTIADQYRAAMTSGTPLTLFTHGPERSEGGGTDWEESQAGLYLPAEHRFVPMGPRLRERGVAGASGFGGYALNATRYDPERRRVLAILARGSDAEGGSLLGPVEARIYDAPTGAVLMSQHFSVNGMEIQGRLDDEGAILGFSDFDDDSITYRLALRATGVTRSRAPLESTGVLAATGVTWGYVQTLPLPAHPAELTLPDGRSVSLGRAPIDEERAVVTSSDPDVIWIITGEHGDCGVRDHYRVEHMVLSTGARTEVQAGVDGYVEIEEGSDGALYLQVHDTLWRFPDRGRGPGEQLWPGLGITSMANDFNPYC